MPYYIGKEIEDRSKLAVQTPKSLHSRLNIDVRVLSTVTSIETEQQKVTVNNGSTGETYEETYDHLILAVGAMPFKPPIEGLDRPGLFSLRNLQDMDGIANHELNLWHWAWASCYIYNTNA